MLWTFVCDLIGVTPSAMSRVLVVEKTGSIQTLLRDRFEHDGVCVDAMPLVGAAIEKFKAARYDVLIWEVAGSKTEQSRGLELLDLLTSDSIRTYAIVVTDKKGRSLSLERLRAYAHRTLIRPFDPDELCALVGQALNQQASRGTVDNFRQASIPLEFEGMLGISLPMREVFQRILEAASED